MFGDRNAIECTPSNGVDVQRPSLLDQLKDRLARDQKRVDELTKAIAALEANPQVAEILILLNRVI